MSLIFLNFRTYICTLIFILVPFINVEKKDGHVSTLVAAQFSESHENEALPDDKDVLLPQPKEPKTISTLCQASKSTHRTMESGWSSALEKIHLHVCGQAYMHVNCMVSMYIGVGTRGGIEVMSSDFTKGARWYLDQIDL